MHESSDLRAMHPQEIQALLTDFADLTNPHNSDKHIDNNCLRHCVLVTAGKSHLSS